VIVRNTLRVLATVGLLAVSSAACSDKTVTTPPAASPDTTVANIGTATNSNTNGGANSANGSVTDAADDARLNEVDQMLRDIEADLGAADQDATTPEGDPTR
jgi:hypothetical protein